MTQKYIIQQTDVHIEKNELIFKIMVLLPVFILSEACPSGSPKFIYAILLIKSHFKRCS